MSKHAATPVRFDPTVAERLSSFVAANPNYAPQATTSSLPSPVLSDRTRGRRELAARRGGPVSLAIAAGRGGAVGL